MVYEKFPPFQNRGNNNPGNSSPYNRSILSLVQSAACIGRKAVLKCARGPCPSPNPLAGKALW